MKNRRTASSLVRRRLAKGRLGERGSVAVEAAIIFPVLVMLTFGIIEFSLLMRDHTATTSLVRAGARTASALPRDPDLIASTVAAMEKAGSALPKDTYEELWIYRANDDGFPGSATSWDSAVCNTDCVKYAWNDARDAFSPVAGTWPVTNINACPGDEDAQAVGVYLKAKHTWITGLFFDETTVADRAVLQFEPLPVYSCK